MVLLSLLACSNPEAPQELDELVGFFFTHAMDDEQDYLQVGGANIAAWMDARLDETLDGYSVKTLDQATLDALDGKDRPAGDLLGAAVGHESPHTPWELAASVAIAYPTERNPDRAVSYERSNETDRDCFLRETCDRYVFDFTGVTALPLGIEVESSFRQQMRWFQMPDGGEAFVEANWMHEPATINADWLEVRAQYYVWVSVPHEGGSRNMYATWADTRFVGDSVPETLGVDLAIGTMQDDAVALDTWTTENPPSP
jgi:hypothetical protein